MSHNWLKNESGPKILVEAYKHIGTKEVAGPRNNPIILEWAEATGLDKVYNADEIPWCGLFIAYVCKVTAKEVVKSPLWARNWLKWGDKVAEPMLGDILVFSRGSGGHVGLYVGEDSKAYHVLGGNQGDAVSVVRINKNRLLGARRTPWKIAQPANVRKIFLTEKGKLSTNEI